ncbi:MAG: hypothetical protein H7321_00835 [Bacteroidia bacterium]|nr:hypothetical protein [Bacteroidia bacterium]
MEKIYTVNRNRAQAPVYACFALAAFLCSLVILKLMPDTDFIDKFWWLFILADFVAFASILFILLAAKAPPFNKKYYVKVDELGLEYRLHIFNRPTVLLWQYIETVNFQLYEINMKLRDSKAIASLQTNYLSEEDAESLKTEISKHVTKA